MSRESRLWQYSFKQLEEREHLEAQLPDHTFHAVPLKETRGLHPAHPAHQRMSQRKIGWIQQGGYWFNSRGEPVQGMIDPMALQATLILKAVYRELVEDRYARG